MRLYEGIVGDGVREYPLVALGEKNAQHVFNRMQRAGGHPLLLQHVHHRVHVQEDQIEAREDFDYEIYAHASEQLINQTLAYTTVAQLARRRGAFTQCVCAHQV